MKYVSIFLVIITDTSASIFSETLRAFTVILENSEDPEITTKCLQKWKKLFNFPWKNLNTQKSQNILDVTKRLERNYSLGKLYNEMF